MALLSLVNQEVYSVDLDLFIIVPEGLNSNEVMIKIFTGQKDKYLEKFNHGEIIDLFSDFCLKGSTSQRIRVHGEFPVYILKDRKSKL